jgi:hypothetical protein
VSGHSKKRSQSFPRPGEVQFLAGHPLKLIPDATLQAA